MREEESRSRAEYGGAGPGRDQSAHQVVGIVDVTREGKLRGPRGRSAAESPECGRSSRLASDALLDALSAPALGRPGCGRRFPSWNICEGSRETRQA